MRNEKRIDMIIKTLNWIANETEFVFAADTLREAVSIIGDAVPAVQGKWISEHHTIRVSSDMIITGTYPTCDLCDYAEVGMAKHTNYCPNCGAKMEGAE